MHQLQRVQQLPTSVTEAWGFLSDPSNLSKITPPALNFTVTSNPPREMYPGLIITYRVSPFGPWLPMTWVSEITHIRSPSYFVDEQRRGPYAMWHHEHFIHPTGSGVEIEDKISYALPCGYLGRLLQPILVANKLSEIFDYRAQALARIFTPI